MKIRSIYLFLIFIFIAPVFSSCKQKIALESSAGDVGFFTGTFSSAQQNALKGKTLLLTLSVPSSEDSRVLEDVMLENLFSIEYTFSQRKSAFVTAQYIPQSHIFVSAGIYIAPQDVITGVKVSGLVESKIIRAQIVDAAVGYQMQELNEAIPAHLGFLFGPQGGKIPVRGASIADSISGIKADFSDYEGLFGEGALGARYQIKSKKTNASLELDFLSSKDKISVDFFNTNSHVIQAAALKVPFGRVDFSSASELEEFLLVPNNPELQKIEQGAVLNPISTDPGLIIKWPESNWRIKQYELFEWDSFPGVLFFDCQDYEIQSKFFTRLAFFAEKAGYRGKILSDEKLEGKHGYNAHDYRPETLADFFTLAKKKNFQLNNYEILLCDILLKNGVILQNADESYSPGRGAVISLSKESDNYLRNTFVNHESWHAIYFTQEQFRETVDFVYSIMDPNSYEFMCNYFSIWPSLQYDPEDKYLMKNEFMAYLMQQTVSKCGQYFVHLANFPTCLREIPNLSRYVIDSNGAGFEDACKVLDSYAEQTWGLHAGKVYYISR